MHRCTHHPDPEQAGLFPHEAPFPPAPHPLVGVPWGILGFPPCSWVSVPAVGIVVQVGFCSCLGDSGLLAAERALNAQLDGASLGRTSVKLPPTALAFGASIPRRTSQAPLWPPGPSLSASWRPPPGAPTHPALVYSCVSCRHRRTLGRNSLPWPPLAPHMAPWPSSFPCLQGWRCEQLWRQGLVSPWRTGAFTADLYLEHGRRLPGPSHRSVARPVFH